MNCPYCSHPDTKVIDSRDVDDGVRRRRECVICGQRFTTYERFQPAGLFVVKKDQRREEFNKEKLLSGLRRACEKRPLPAGAVDKIAGDIEAELYNMGKAEIPSTLLGDMVMEKLKALDNIAYVRFASVYREFTDITQLKKVVDNLVSGQDEGIHKGQLSLLPEDRVSPKTRYQRR
ncbi:transcriptional regulator NrdR [Dehalococcoides mccartyi]|uniref:Transcriptional repressor NrdR n=1 Tax=Dehalococcoides mccartyi TaxID=61435 RepID=A0AB38ZBP3_9CHLR|nr:transcriptional regulator NrdR [Dehalococcoides mccartyi]WRO07985.1 transcriptional regulator NrdR [Dehalococcoides mccartyi]